MTKDNSELTSPLEHEEKGNASDTKPSPSPFNDEREIDRGHRAQAFSFAISGSGSGAGGTAVATNISMRIAGGGAVHLSSRILKEQVRRQTMRGIQIATLTSNCHPALRRCDRKARPYERGAEGGARHHHIKSCLSSTRPIANLLLNRQALTL